MGIWENHILFLLSGNFGGGGGLYLMLAVFSSFLLLCCHGLVCSMFCSFYVLEDGQAMDFLLWNIVCYNGLVCFVSFEIEGDGVGWVLAKPWIPYCWDIVSLLLCLLAL